MEGQSGRAAERQRRKNIDTEKNENDKGLDRQLGSNQQIITSSLGMGGRERAE